MSIGNIIAENRKRMNLSQEQLAARISVSRSAVAKWESDKKDKQAISLIEFSNIDREFFIGKNTNLNLNEKHVWSGVFGRNTEFLNVVISSFSNNELVIEEAEKISNITIPIDEIVKIEVA